MLLVGKYWSNFIYTINQTPMFVRGGIVSLWTLMLIILLVQPNHAQVIANPMTQGEPSLEREIFFTGIHLVTFAITTLLWWWALITNWTSPTALLLAMGLASILGIVTELAQVFASGRSTTWYDLLANLCGVCLIWLIARVYETRLATLL